MARRGTSGRKPAPKKPSRLKAARPKKPAKAVARPARGVRTRIPVKKVPTPKPAAPTKRAAPARPVPAAKAAPAAKPLPAAKAAPAAKPVPAAKTAPPPPAPVKEPPKQKVTLSEKDLTQIRADLESAKALYEKELKDLESSSFDTSQSELSGEVSFDEEYADAGTFTFERERDLSLGNNIRDLLERVNHALVKLDAGKYGACERCGQPIDKQRLRALPYSNLCIRCKQLEERVR